MTVNKLRALIMGCPGSGKGTLTGRIVKRFPEIQSFASGDIFRNHIIKKTPLGVRVESILAEGGLVPDHLVTPMMLAHLDTSSPDCWILDGYPRTVKQAMELDDHLSKEQSPINFVINLDVDWHIILDRIENRWIHPQSGRTYNKHFNPPRRAGFDDLTGEPLAKRSDDTVESFKIRLENYEKQTLPLKEYYGKRGVLKNFKGDSTDEISPHVFEELEQFYKR